MGEHCLKDNGRFVVVVILLHYRVLESLGLLLLSAALVEVLLYELRLFLLWAILTILQLMLDAAVLVWRVQTNDSVLLVPVVAVTGFPVVIVCLAVLSASVIRAGGCRRGPLVRTVQLLSERLACGRVRFEALDKQSHVLVQPGLHLEAFFHCHI